MAIITMPSTLPLGDGSGMGLRRFDLVASSETTGAEQTRMLGPARWLLTLAQPASLTGPPAGAWLALLASLRGRTNHLLAWDPARIAPLGTMRGTPTTAGTNGAGATTLGIATGQAGCTLKAGDWLQVGSGLGSSQLVMVTADATADGSGLIVPNIEHSLRQTFAAGTAVTWLRASTYFRMQSDGAAWRYAAGGLVTGMSIDLMESWS